MRQSILPFLCIFGICLACSSKHEKIPPLEKGQEKGKIIIYELIPRLFGNKTVPTKPFGTIEENGVGKFNDISDLALNSIKDLGVTHVWYAGVLEHPLATDYTAEGIPLDDADVIKGRAGSPFVIKDYFDVDPDLTVDIKNRMAEFLNLVERTHKQGLGVLIDFVPKEVARSYASDAKPENVEDFGAMDDSTQQFLINNNFYYLPHQPFKVPKTYRPLGNYSFPTKDGKFQEFPAKVSGTGLITASPEIVDDFDAVRLNYGLDIFAENASLKNDSIPDTWKKMRQILLYWCDKGVNGFFCHESDQVPIDFWKWVIPEVKQTYPEILFIAGTNSNEFITEASSAEFDLIQDNVLYQSLASMLQMNASATYVQAGKSAIKDSRLLHFMEIHSKPRLASTAFHQDVWGGSQASLISATIDKGSYLIYAGQELGESASGLSGFSGDNGITTLYDYWNIPTIQGLIQHNYNLTELPLEQQQIRMFYKDVLQLAKTNEAIAFGDQYDLTAFNVKKGNISDKVSVFMRVKGSERILIINGFNKDPELAKIQIPDDIVKKIELDNNNIYLARDLLWREVEVAFDKTWTIEVNIRPFTGLVLKIK